mgnify:FL=1
MPHPLTAVGFDADDTLWHNETQFHLTQARLAALLADHADPHRLQDRLLEAERRNLALYGYGVKGFVLSMIETAIEVTEGRVPAAVIAGILAEGRAMLGHPVDLLPHAEAAVRAVSGAGFRVILITKGDLIDQERKIAQSGIADLFDAVEIVSDKTPAVYAAIFARHGTGAAQGLMAGNSLRSDVLPMLAAGGFGAHVPHAVTWALEQAEAPVGDPRFFALPDLSALPALLARLG